MLSKEELLKPRWKVVADFPTNKYKIGEVYTVPDGVMMAYTIEPYNIEWTIFPQLYPAIFKKLEWWEERSIEELPEYLQEIINGKQVVYQVFEYHLWQGIVLIEDSPEVLYLENLQPSTKDEYEKTN